MSGHEYLPCGKPSSERREHRSTAGSSYLRTAISPNWRAWPGAHRSSLRRVGLKRLLHIGGETIYALVEVDRLRRHENADAGRLDDPAGTFSALSTTASVLPSTASRLRTVAATTLISISAMASVGTGGGPCVCIATGATSTTAGEHHASCGALRDLVSRGISHPGEELRWHHIMPTCHIVDDDARFERLGDDRDRRRRGTSAAALGR